MNGKRGFTLTELVVVAAVLAVVSAILLPVFIQVREKSRSSTCSSNLRQINQAVSLYCSDNDGYFPPVAIQHQTPNTNDVLWYELVAIYLKANTLSCADVTLKGEFSGRQDQFYFSGYALNSSLGNEKRVKSRFFIQGLGETRLGYPSTTITLLEARAGITAMAAPDIFPWRVVSPWRKEPDRINLGYYEEELSQQRGGAERHSGGANYAFADGHVKWFKPEQLSASPTNDGVHPGFGL